MLSPRIVVVEIQEFLGPTKRLTRPYDPKFRADGIPSMLFLRASLGAYTFLAKKKGYRLVGCIRNGFNAFFVRNDVKADLDHVFGTGEYAPEGCFAHDDQRWQKVLDQRLQESTKHTWIDPSAAP